MIPVASSTVAVLEARRRKATPARTRRALASSSRPRKAGPDGGRLGMLGIWARSMLRRAPSRARD